MIKKIFQTTFAFKSRLTTNTVKLHTQSIKYTFCISVNEQQRIKHSKQYERDIIKLISKYPYCILPKTENIKGHLDVFSDQTKNNLLSFQALFTLPTKNKVLSQIQSNLFGISQNNKNKSGQQIFTRFHMKKIKKYIKQINMIEELTDTNIKQKVLTFQILCHLKYSKQLEVNVKMIQLKAIENNLIMLSLYIKLLINSNLPYIQHIQKIFDRIKTNQEKQDILQASKILITVQRFQQILPKNLIDLCILKFKQNLNVLSSTDLWMIIKLIFLYKSDVARQFVQELSQNILQSHKNGLKLHIPLILKVIKYRSKFGLSNQNFQSLINANADRFQSIFHSKMSMSKQKLMTIISQKNNEHLPPEFREKFRNYILNTISKYSQSQQVNQVQLIRDLKLLIKYNNNLTPIDIQKIQKNLMEKISPKFQQQSSQDLKYYLFLSVFRSYKKQSKERFTPNILQFFKSQAEPLLNLYHSYCLEGKLQINQIYQKLINICYQVYRLDLTHIVQIPNIFNYQMIKNCYLSVQCYSNFFYLLKKTPFQKNDKLKTFEALKKDISVKLIKGMFGLKNIYTLIDSLNRMDYDFDKYVYVDIQQGIAKQLQKIIDHNAKMLPLPKDILFLKITLVQKNRCSEKFKKFIIETNQNHQLILQYTKEYLRLQKDWLNMKQNRKKNNYNKDRKEGYNSKNKYNDE